MDGRDAHKDRKSMNLPHAQSDERQKSGGRKKVASKKGIVKKETFHRILQSFKRRYLEIPTG